MKIPLYPELTFLPEQLFWRRDLAVRAFSADAFAKLIFHLIWKHFRGVLPNESAGSFKP
jgi:hypothetical protein